MEPPLLPSDQTQQPAEDQQRAAQQSGVVLCASQPPKRFLIIACYEGTVLEVMALSQLMITSIISSLGLPYRQPWYSNRWHVIVLLLQGSFLLYALFSSGNDFLFGFLGLWYLPRRFACELLFLMCMNLILCLLVTYLIEEYVDRKMTKRWYEVITIQEMEEAEVKASRERQEQERKKRAQIDHHVIRSDSEGEEFTV